MESSCHETWQFIPNAMELKAMSKDIGLLFVLVIAEQILLVSGVLCNKYITGHQHIKYGFYIAVRNCCILPEKKKSLRLT